MKITVIALLLSLFWESPLAALVYSLAFSAFSFSVLISKNFSFHPVWFMKKMQLLIFLVGQESLFRTCGKACWANDAEMKNNLYRAQLLFWVQKFCNCFRKAMLPSRKGFPVIKAPLLVCSAAVTDQIYWLCFPVWILYVLAQWFLLNLQKIVNWKGNK